MDEFSSLSHCCDSLGHSTRTSTVNVKSYNTCVFLLGLGLGALSEITHCVVLSECKVRVNLSWIMESEYHSAFWSRVEPMVANQLIYTIMHLGHVERQKKLCRENYIVSCPAMSSLHSLLNQSSWIQSSEQVNDFRHNHCFTYFANIRHQ